ncbi:ribosome silencing factor [Hydrogenophaga sp.]|uniref:ribosome silencing factor n=1 Tax=Hydrogenophaga sp. TaxID=1904254 RepID=UPI003D128405
MTSETTAKKDIQRLQRAIVDGLEDVKGQDIVVFNTEHLSPLFERVIVASGTSNRQTKALAASVRDAVREAGFDKPRIEGEDNGEWIIVDCGAAVAHVMQPVIRQYYRLEEIWGAKPVRLKHGAEKPATPAKSAAKKKAAKAPEAAPVSARKVARKTASKTPATTQAASGRSAAPVASRKAPASKATPAQRPAGKKATPKLVVGKPVAKKSAAKPAARKTSKPAAKKKA